MLRLLLTRFRELGRAPEERPCRASGTVRISRFL